MLMFDISTQTTVLGEQDGGARGIDVRKAFFIKKQGRWEKSKKEKITWKRKEGGGHFWRLGASDQIRKTLLGARTINLNKSVV